MASTAPPATAGTTASPSSAAASSPSASPPASASAFVVPPHANYVHKPSGLFRSTATVRGASVKAGWIVLADGTQVGSLNPDVNAARQTSRAAPKLNLSTLTAQDGGTTLTAAPIDGETGSGF